MPSYVRAGIRKCARIRALSLMPQIKAQMDGMGDDDWLFRATCGGNVWTNTWRKRIWNKAVKRPAWRTRA